MVKLEWVPAGPALWYVHGGEALYVVRGPVHDDGGAVDVYEVGRARAAILPTTRSRVVGMDGARAAINALVQAREGVE